MKKLLALALALTLCLALTVPALAADEVVPSPQALVFNGYGVEDFCAYNINGNNYFKLRDIAALMSGTAAEFAVDWDDATGTVSVTTGGSYVWVGGELENGKDQSDTAVPSPQTVLIDGKACDTLSVYNIGGNNYFRLRDLGDALGFSVDYDAEWNAAIVTTPCDEWQMVSEKHTTPEEGTVTTVYTYDEKGRMSGYSASDGSTSAVFTYNDYGVLLCAQSSGLDLGTGEPWESETLYTGSGKVLSERSSFGGSNDVSEYTYNALGILTGSRSESISDDFCDAHECVYNDRGQLLRQTDSYRWSDGTTETSVTTFTLDEQGRTASYVMESSGLMEDLAWDENGEPISVMAPYSYVAETFFTYDGNTVIQTGRNVYTNADGSESVTGGTVRIVYNDNGQILTETDTMTEDGETIVIERRCTYNDAGQMLSDSLYYYDEAEPRFTETYTYDAAGRTLSDRVDYVYGDYTLQTWTYDAAGNCIADSYEACYSEYDWETDTSAPVVEKSGSTYTYDAEGRPVRYTSDDAEGHYERTLVYDANGNLIRETAVLNGTVIETAVYTYRRA